MKKQKKLTYARAKREAWNAFSRYIRLRDCTDGVGDQAFGNCFTCGRRHEFKQLQAGHFLNGRHNSVLFDERNSHAQCKYCNIIQKGNIQEYYPRMLKDYGQKTIHDLQDLDKQLVKFKVADLVEIKEKYERLLEELNKDAL